VIAVMSALAVEFGSGVVPVGATVTLEHNTRFELGLDVALFGTRSQQRVERVHDEVAVLRRLPDGFEVTWSVNRHRAVEPGHEHDRVLPVLDGPYRSVGGVVDGATEEAAAIVGQLSVFEDLAALRALLGSELEPGDRVPAGPLFAGMITEVPGDPDVQGSLVFRGLDGTGAVGRFDVELELTATGVGPRAATVHTVVEGAGVLEVQVPVGLDHPLRSGRGPCRWKRPASA
jgi:hypothetical protein